MLPRLDIQVWDMLNDDNDDDDDDDDDDGDTSLSLSPSSPPTLFYFPKKNSCSGRNLSRKKLRDTMGTLCALIMRQGPRQFLLSRNLRPVEKC
jgi:hypothetical protein